MNLSTFSQTVPVRLSRGANRTTVRCTITEFNSSHRHDFAGSTCCHPGKSLSITATSAVADHAPLFRSIGWTKTQLPHSQQATRDSLRRHDFAGSTCCHPGKSLAITATSTVADHAPLFRSIGWTKTRLPHSQQAIRRLWPPSRIAVEALSSSM
jgi:hypothetical protein